MIIIEGLDGTGKTMLTDGLLSYDFTCDHFDYDTSPHYHFVCSMCGSVSDLNLPVSSKMTEAAKEGFEGEIEGQVTYFYGRCNKCIQKSGCQSALQHGLPD